MSAKKKTVSLLTKIKNLFENFKFLKQLIEQSTKKKQKNKNTLTACACFLKTCL